MPLLTSNVSFIKTFMKNRKLFAIISLVSLILSACAHIWSLNSNPPMKYLWPLHLSAMVAFGSMVIYLIKEQNSNKYSLKNLKEKVNLLIILVKNQPHLVFANVLAVIVGFSLFQYVAVNFLTEAGTNNEIDNQVKAFSGHWVMFSFIPTIYYYLYYPLQIEYRKNKS